MLDELRAHDWDGVMVDDTLTWQSHPTVEGRRSPQMPDDAAQWTATDSFLWMVGPWLKDEGYQVVPNVTLTHDTWKPVLERWSPLVTGWENEHYVMWGRDGSHPRFTAADDWGWKVRMSAWLAARDLPLLAVSYAGPDDRRAMDYHRATWLLTWNGRTGASMYVATDWLVQQTRAAATAHVGRPHSRRFRDDDGVWWRWYDDGLVLVNPTRDRVVVDVPPGLVDHAGDPVRRVPMASATGVVLRAQGR